MQRKLSNNRAVRHGDIERMLAEWQVSGNHHPCPESSGENERLDIEAEQIHAALTVWAQATGHASGDFDRRADLPGGLVHSRDLEKLRRAAGTEAEKFHRHSHRGRVMAVGLVLVDLGPSPRFQMIARLQNIARISRIPPKMNALRDRVAENVDRSFSPQGAWYHPCTAAKQ